MAEEAIAPQPGGGRRILFLMVAVTLVVAVGFLFFIRSCSGGGVNQSYSVIYSHLELKDASNVIARLKELKIPYEIRDKGTAVAVPKVRADEARLGLAEKNLPMGGAVGWEIFNESKLGATDFDRRIQLIRAISGELARTIRRISAVEDCWVQIVIPETRLFEVTRVPVTASVLLKLIPGERLSPSQVNGIIHLVASSVENLDPKNVVIVDDNGRILSTQPQAQSQPYRSAQYGAEAEQEVIQIKNEPPIITASASTEEAASPAQIKKEEELKKREEALSKMEQELQTLVQQVSQEARPKILSPEEKSLLRLQAKQEYEDQLNQKCQFILNQFYPPNAVIVKVSVEMVLPQITPSKNPKVLKGKKPPPPAAAKEGLEVKRIHAVILVDNRMDLNKILKKTTYTTIASAIGYDKKRGDRILIRRVPFHFALTPSTTVEVTAPLPPAKTGVSRLGEDFAVWAGSVNLTWAGCAMVVVLLLILIFRTFGRGQKNKFRIGTQDLLKEEEEVPAGKVSSQAVNTLETVREIARNNPERLAGLLKNWLSEEGVEK
ncbi:MAG: flagellar basal-body MS-ring/collar protein FliF [Candidatus Margulisiibacteriota bacterium]